MRRWYPFILAITLVPLATVAFAQPSASRADKRGDGSDRRVMLVEDQDAAVFRFVIDGREVARLDHEGLHVRESIEFGGTLTDTGTAYYDAKAKAPPLPDGAR